MTMHDPVETLRQMRDFAEEAAHLASGHSAADLVSDLSYRRHAERIAELIGEAANRLPQAIHDQWPEVPWREMIGMRNWLIHGYDGIDAEILWDVLQHHSPILLPQLDQIIHALKESRQPQPGSEPSPGQGI